MVSGLVTSPCDHSRIFSGDARLICIDSKLFSSYSLLLLFKEYLPFLQLLTLEIIVKVEVGRLVVESVVIVFIVGVLLSKAIV